MAEKISQVNVQPLTHAFNLEGELFTLEMTGQPLLIVQVTNYAPVAEPSFAQASNTSPSIATLLGFEPLPGSGPEELNRVRVSGPTAVCLYTVYGEPFLTLSVRVAESSSLPPGVFYAKSYSENAEVYHKLRELAVLVPVEGYKSAFVGYAGTVEAYRLNPAFFASPGTPLSTSTTSSSSRSPSDHKRYE